MDGWMDGWMEVKAVLRIAYSNQKQINIYKTKEIRTKANNYKQKEQIQTRMNNYKPAWIYKC
jgi:hypothetical protein